MVIDFIGALASGLGLLGLVMLINRVVLRGRFGRWIYPATVALGMVAYTVWAEYTWPTRTMEAQPQLLLAGENAESVVYRPWTYLWPQVSVMIAVDRSETRVNPAFPHLVMTQVVRLARWQPVRGYLTVFDCEGNARALMGEGVELSADGALEGATWEPLNAEDPVLRAACSVAEEIGNGRGSGT